jgi:hypothetical protein
MTVMSKPNFLGMSGFYWWIGVVEQRIDPLYLGRVKARIFGLHTDNLQLIPSDDLPWAHPVVPLNNADTSQVPKEGQWVVGFFLDGASCQSPAYFGVIPGIPQDPPDIPPQVGFRDLRTADELAEAPATPASVEMPTDGSGATVTNQPAQRFPFVFGFPTLPTLAINDPNNQPQEIVDRLENTVENIQGPDAKNLADTIAAAGEGALSAITGSIPDIKSLLPDPSSLASSINVSDISSNVTSAATDALSQAKSAISSSVQQASSLLNSDEFKSNLSQAQSQFQSAFAEAQGKLADAQAQAQASISAGISDLSSQVSGIADQISSKLSSLAGGNISTQFPVNLDGGIPKVDISGSLSSITGQLGSIIPGGLSSITSQLSNLSPEISSSLSNINLSDIPLNIPLNQVDTAIGSLGSQISQLQSLVSTLGK